jgi:ElaB/YqjD/DUF883 family membrane-anchored ribosome-binding protein
MQASAKSSNFEKAANEASEDLNHIIAQAEDLLRQLGEDSGAAAEAVRERVTQTLNQAKARLAATAVEAEEVVDSIAQRTDRYVRANPWQSLAIAAVLGGAITLLISRATRK